MACTDEKCDFQPIKFQRRAPGAEDIVIDMKYCGVCHTDVHFSASHFAAFGMKPEYPFIPGHELAGICVEVGSSVQKFKVGDHVGVGCMVDSCQQCAQCLAGNEQKCKKENTGTYGKADAHGRAAVWPPESQTKGGYCTRMVVHEKFGIYIPKSYPLECAGPVFCAGITMYDPMVEHGFKAGNRVGIVGLGGLGQMGVKLAKELGCVVSAISRGKQKEAAARRMGATTFVDAKSAADMAQNAKSLDFIINTIPAHHTIDPYMPLLTESGKMIMVGACPTMYAAFLFGGNKKVCASLIGGVKRTEELIILCDKASPKIQPEVAVKTVQEINAIYEILDKGNDNGVRYVLDLGSLSEATFGTCKAPPPALKAAQGMDFKTVLSEALKLMGCPCCK